MKNTGIYKIESRLKAKRIYIGSSVNINARWNKHLSELRKNIHSNSKLQRHYNKYGKNDLIFSILICCDKEDLLSTEQFYLDIYNPYFNISPIAGSTLGPWKGKKLSDEHRKKLSESHKGIQTGENHPMFGKHHSEESKKKVSKSKKGNSPAWNKGKHPSEKIKQKISESLKGNIPWNKGKTDIYSEETKRNISRSLKNYYQLKKII